MDRSEVKGFRFVLSVQTWPILWYWNDQRSTDIFSEFLSTFKYAMFMV